MSSPKARAVRPFSPAQSIPDPLASSARRPHSERANEDISGLSTDRAVSFTRPRSGSTSSLAQTRTPTRSFVHRSFHGSQEQAYYATSGVRKQTAELASLAKGDKASIDRSNLLEDGYPAAIEELSEPASPDDGTNEHLPTGTIPAASTIPSAFVSNAELEQGQPKITVEFDNQNWAGSDSNMGANEQTALLGDRKTSIAQDGSTDIEGQVSGRSHGIWHAGVTKVSHGVYTVSHPKTWSAKAIWSEGVLRPARLLPAVFLGLLLNILDALSYGMILFPLGHQIFDSLGSDGIAMFYVSTIVAQVVFSSGGSVFRGGIGSEMIEVVPFFHQMAFAIVDRVGEDKPHAVLATTILAFAISAFITGAVFFLMGVCGLGSLIGFFPRHILIGCIGGVGWFLVATGLEVSARLPGNLEYNLDTLKQLFSADTIALWLIPLCLAIVLLVLQRFVKSNFLVGGYFISVALLFYLFKLILGLNMADLHSGGWVFDAPPAEKPWYHFYTLYDMGAVDWVALADTIPAMFALTFFGVLHVPINVPALGISTGEDNLNVDRELIAHGVSNCLSGLFGSIQNYLVYTNSLLFMDSGGNDRLAGLMLSAATFGILIAGPVIIGFIPVMVVGALIFLLGIELLEEALVDTFGKVHRLEYVTILVIVVTMGVWDFVTGILVGIVLAALSFVVQTSRREAIRAAYSGKIARSTVRRPPVQLKFLKEVGEQIFVLKMTGFLFFGTIVGVENRIRALLEEEAFQSRPLRFLVLDMSHINGIDFSAAEAFTRVNRLLQKKSVELVISGLDLNGEIGRALRNVGLLDIDSEVVVHETLNEALEACENQLLTALYRQQESRRSRRAMKLDVPHQSNTDFSASYRAEFLVSSPRRHHLHESATTALAEETSTRQKWNIFRQPLPLLLQTFEDVSDRNEDFWQRATKYFERATYPKGSVLFNIGDQPHAFYMLEEGILRAEYQLPQGSYAELIVAGRPCGELPFFSDTPRTANMTAEKDCVVWQLTIDSWREVQRRDTEVAQELLKVSLKLTKERMEVITSYVMTTAG